jgi:hypothetical protein
MKTKGVLFLLAFLFLFVCASTDSCSAGYTSATEGRMKTEKAQTEMIDTAISSVEVPRVSYFQERRTISKWTKRWDKPSIATYVYLVSYGTIIGYYVADGKPASTRSYLVPEEQRIQADLGEYVGDMLVSAPDIDGTYGDNNPGIRFFTAEGTAVEWGGQGACYIYSDAPLPLRVPKLNVQVKNQ